MARASPRPRLRRRTRLAGSTPPCGASSVRPPGAQVAARRSPTSPACGCPPRRSSEVRLRFSLPTSSRVCEVASALDSKSVARRLPGLAEVNRSQSIGLLAAKAAWLRTRSGSSNRPHSDDALVPFEPRHRLRHDGLVRGGLGHDIRRSSRGCGIGGAFRSPQPPRTVRMRR